MLDEVAELVEDLGLFLLGLGRRFLADLVEQGFRGEQRRGATHGEGDGVGEGPARQHGEVALGLAQVQLGEVRGGRGSR